MIRTIPDLIEIRAEQNPTAKAMLSPGRRPLTYGGLHTQIQYAIQILQAMGVGRNDRVAAAMPSGPEMAVPFLAVSCCATCVPLNPALDAAEFRLRLVDLKPRALLVGSGLDSPARSVARVLDIPTLSRIESLPDADPQGAMHLSCED